MWAMCGGGGAMVNSKERGHCPRNPWSYGVVTLRRRKRRQAEAAGTVSRTFNCSVVLVSTTPGAQAERSPEASTLVVLVVAGGMDRLTVSVR